MATLVFATAPFATGCCLVLALAGCGGATADEAADDESIPTSELRASREDAPAEASAGAKRSCPDEAADLPLGSAKPGSADGSPKRKRPPE